MITIAGGIILGFFGICALCMLLALIAGYLEEIWNGIKMIAALSLFAGCVTFYVLCFVMPG